MAPEAHFIGGPALTTSMGTTPRTLRVPTIAGELLGARYQIALDPVGEPAEQAGQATGQPVEITSRPRGAPLA